MILAIFSESAYNSSGTTSTMSKPRGGVTNSCCPRRARRRVLPALRRVFALLFLLPRCPKAQQSIPSSLPRGGVSIGHALASGAVCTGRGMCKFENLPLR
eukprot:6198803-Pleurochrysis_carterae.AAC.1